MTYECDSDQVSDEKRALNVRRWVPAAILALLLHGTAIAMVIGWRGAATPGDPPATVMIELALSAQAPDVPDLKTAPGPQMTEAQPEASASEQNEQPDQPKLPESPTADIALPPPSKPQPSKPAPKDKAVENRKPSISQKHAALQTTAPKPVQARPAERVAAPLSASAQMPSMSAAAWANTVAAYINRFATGSAAGSAVVAYVVDRSGRVLSSSLRQSSGDKALDAEAVALPRRASPVPPPPESVHGNTSTLTTTVRFR